MSSESDFVDDIVPDYRPEHTSPLHHKFMPWHRVRKEFIRQRQWNELTNRLVKRRWKRELAQLNFQLDSEEANHEDYTDLEQKRNPLRCLVIPGDHLLDIRALWRDSKDLGCDISYLGFNERQGSTQEGTAVHIANNAVTALPRVWKNSQVIPDRFESIVSQDSQARRYLISHGPYHVVNLDFCGSVFPNTQSETQHYHEAVHRTLEYQFAEQKSPWLLFVTTEVQPSILDERALKAFCDLTQKNYTEHKEFRDELDEILSASAFNSEENQVDLANLREDEIVKLFGISFGKWLLKLSHNAQPNWTIQMRRSYQYQINDEKGAVMLALAFEFSPNISPPTDATGISNLDVAEKDFATEVECAVKIAKSVGSIEDIDKKLEEDLELKKKLAEDHAKLLSLAGFDHDSYLAWVDAGEII